MTDRSLPPPGDDPQVPEYEVSPEEATRAVHSRAEKGTVISVADLVGAKVVTPDGAKRGTVTEVLLGPAPDLWIQGLVVGAGGWLHRLRLAPLFRFATGQRPLMDEVPWDAVDRWDGLQVVLREEAEHEGVKEE